MSVMTAHGNPIPHSIASTHDECRDGKHTLLIHSDIEITCEEWDRFVQWQKNFGRMHDPLPEGQYVDLPRYLDHEHCECRQT